MRSSGVKKLVPSEVTNRPRERSQPSEKSTEVQKHDGKH
jgi:hypothetical protein